MYSPHRLRRVTAGGGDNEHGTLLHIRELNKQLNVVRIINTRFPTAEERTSSYRQAKN